jgi:serine protease Do
MARFTFARVPAGRLGLPAAVALAAVAAGGGGVGAAEPLRHNAVVDAVRKTHSSIVTVKVEKQGSYGRKEVVGTGVIVDDRGYVVTNRHVIADAVRVVAHLPDGTDCEARVRVEDDDHDLAVLKLPDGKKYPELPFGPGGDLMVGEDVIAVGHPFGYTDTVSTGVVSAVGREIHMPSGETLTDLIQTSAGLNPGNSGGPLLNIKGELIGINVALRDGAQGIAFALNSDAVQLLLSRRLSAGKMAKVNHGLACREHVLAEEGPDRQQVVVDEVAEKSPAAAAGVKPGDVLLKVNDRAVTNRFDLERALWDSKPGQDVEAVVSRAGESITLRLTLAAAPEDGKRVTAKGR